MAISVAKPTTITINIVRTHQGDSAGSSAVSGCAAMLIIRSRRYQQQRARGRAYPGVLRAQERDSPMLRALY